MRISDWSSDVCSSYLSCAGIHEALRKGSSKMTQDDSRAGSLGGLRVMVIDDSKTIRRTAETLLKRAGAEVTTATDGFEAPAKIAEQIGRAACREIVCPSVEISVGARTLKKKKQ